MIDALLRSLRAQRGRRGENSIARSLSTAQPSRRLPVASRRFIPVIEHLEERNLLSSASPGVFVLGTGAPAAGSLPGGFNPAQIRQAYGFNQITFNNGAVRGDGSGQTIAIVDAYDQPNLASDLAEFDSTFGIAAPPSFTKVNETGGSALPAPSASWGLEESLDVEWAHAIAPGANILLVEANTSSVLDLLTAVNYARNVPGVSVVSMSFGAGEWSGEAAYDGYFTTPAGHSNVSFIASSGDSGSAGAPEWPSVSPNVLAIGGTQLSTDGSGDYLGEIGWSGSGGGVSLYEPQPAYQQGVVTQSSTSRTVPDVAYDASSGSPFAIYDSASYSGWIEVYGTSCGAPQWAALVAIADQGRVLAGKTTLDGPSELLPMIYSSSAADFHDVTTGSNGEYSAGIGYDLVTGRGSPIANALVPNLVGPAPIPQTGTFTSLTSNADPSVYGQPIRFTAQVSAIGGTPTGVVDFMEGGVVLSTGTLNYGIAVFTTNSLDPGDSGITAVYEGGGTYGGSTSFPVFQYVLPASTTNSLSSSANPATAGQRVTFTAVVAPVAPGQGTATGEVYFLLGSTVIGFAPLNGGSASFTVSTLPTGNGRMLAVFGGDGQFMGAASSPLMETIKPSAGTEDASASLTPPPNTPAGASADAIIGPALHPAGISSPDGRADPVSQAGESIALSQSAAEAVSGEDSAASLADTESGASEAPGGLGVASSRGREVGNQAASIQGDELYTAWSASGNRVGALDKALQVAFRGAFSRLGDSDGAAAVGGDWVADMFNDQA
jgi:hypothetical protein